jgi:O-antigen ligase
MKSTLALAALLAFSVATLWVPARWALSGVETGAFLLTFVVAWRARLAVAGVALAPAFLCVWAFTQLAAHWTAVPAATVDACLYWLAAACFLYLGTQADRERLLNYALGIGLVICVAGTVQLFTSPGNVFWVFPSGFDRRVVGPFVSPNNYSAFVELLVPIALTRRGAWGSLVAAVLAATVAASGSRAGAILVAVEIVAILALQRRARDFALIGALAAACVGVVGHQFLWDRFAQSDPFAVRREFLESTVAMFRAQPLHGFGLGTWPWTYPRFAVIDTGEFANHAHNEWAQWAAEGGVPAIAAMLLLLAWVAPRAVRNLWAIGLLALLLHSLVDYPFLRLGLGAWFFTLAGVLSARSGPAIRVPRFACCAALLFATFYAARLAYADALYRRATPESVNQAVRVASRAEYLFTLAQLEPEHAARHLQAALIDNPYDTKARIALAQERELSGDATDAERLLLEAARLDRQFAPAWALANFYLRRNSADPFWSWAQRAAAMSFSDRRALFDLCFLTSDDAAAVFERIGNPQLEEPFFRYLIANRGAASADDMALRLARRFAQKAKSSLQDTLFDYVDESILEGRAEAAWQVWKLTGEPANGRGFDWHVAAADGVYVMRDGGEWRVEFSGREAEACELLRRPLPHGDFALRYEYRTDNLAPQTGLSWDATPIKASSDWRVASIPAAGDGLRLAYRRPSGSVRAEGVLWLRNLRLEAASASVLVSSKSADKEIRCCK